MAREQDLEKSPSDREEDIPPIIAAYPIIARGIFGSSPEEVLENTKGKVSQFYYLFVLVQYVLAQFFFWLAPENMDPPIQEFLIGHLGYGTGDWLSGALLLMVCADLALAISLRVLLFPVGSDGRADWRWNQRT